MPVGGNVCVFCKFFKIYSSVGYPQLWGGRGTCAVAGPLYERTEHPCRLNGASF